MKNHLLLKSNLLMTAIIAVCFFGMIYTNSRSYQQLMEEHVESVVQMSAAATKIEIENNLQERLTVARSMAKDVFLQDWALAEPDHAGDADYLEKLYTYLNAYKTTYHYATVFCVVDASGNYYYQEGYNKTMQVGNAHDVWYYNFLELNQEYDIQVDTDEINGDLPTIFVNYRMTDRDGALLGVVGVAVELTDVQRFIHHRERENDLTMYLVNRGGARNSFAQATEHFVTEEEALDFLGGGEPAALTESESGALRWHDEKDARICSVDTYSSLLKWNLIAVKNTDSLFRVFMRKLAASTVAVIGILGTCIFASSFIFFRYNAKVVAFENVDELTGLMNRKLFEKRFSWFVKRGKPGKKTLFMLDIDNFKQVNDANGHVYGNAVLATVGEEIQRLTAGRGYAARWGGDEFIGILDEEPEKTAAAIRALMGRLFQGGAPVTISVGILAVDGGSVLTECMSRVDTSLYQAKNSGKNQIVCAAD